MDSSDTSQPRASSSKSFNLTDQEKDVIEELRSWASQKESLNKKFIITNLKDLSTSQTFINLLCQVVAKSYTAAGNGVALTLWDGSLPACQSTLVEPISEQGQIKSEELMPKSANRCVDVFLYDNHVEGDVRKLSPGDFVCIRNVHVKELEASTNMTTDEPEVMLLRPHVSLIVHGGTICGRGLEILSQSDPMVSLSATVKLIAEAETSVTQQQQKQQLHTTEGRLIDANDRPTTNGCCETQQEVQDFIVGGCKTPLIVKEVNRALQTSCTITEHPCIPFSSLKDIKACKTVPYKFRCRVKAVMYRPSEMKYFIRRSCQSCKYILSDSSSSVSSSTINEPSLCSQCSEELTLAYLFSFVLEDDTGLLHAMVFDTDAKTFFPDLPPPKDFLDQPSLQESVHEWMLSMTHNPDNSIEFVNQDPRGDKRPWLELCLFSYLPDRDCGKVQYRVFDSTYVHEG